MIVGLLMSATVLLVCAGLCWWNTRKMLGTKLFSRVDVVAMVSDAVFVWLILQAVASLTSNLDAPIWTSLVLVAPVLTVGHAVWLGVMRWPAATAKVTGASITSLSVSLVLVAAAAAARIAPLVVS